MIKNIMPMNRDEPNIDRLFRDRFTGFGDQPGKEAWASIDHDLDRIKKRRLLRYLRMAAASVVLLLAFGAGYYFALMNGKPSELVTKMPESGKILHSKAGSYQQNFPVSPPKKNTANATDVHSDNVQESSPMQVVINKPTSNIPLNEVIEMPSHNVPLAEATYDAEKNGIPETSVINDNVPVISQDNTSEILSLITTPIIDPLPDNKIDGQGKIRIGASFSPMISYRDYLSDEQGMSKEDADKAENSLLAFSSGAEFMFSLSPSVEINTGIFYSRIGLESTGALIYKNNDNNLYLYSIVTSAGNIDVREQNIPSEVYFIPSEKDSVSIEDIKNSRIVINFNYLELPLLTRFNIIDRRFELSAGGGVSGSLLLSKSADLEYQGKMNRIGEPGDIRRYLYQTVLFMGVEYPLGKKFRIDVLPTFRYALNNIHKGDNIHYRPYSFSVKTGIIYNF